MSEQKEIRFTLPTAEDHADFSSLCIVKGMTRGEAATKLVKREIEKNRHKLFEEDGSAKWVDQPTLIDALSKLVPPISTNPQTLYNYRTGGRMDGLFGSDGGKGLLYNLRACIDFFREIQSNPRLTRSAKAEA